MVLKNVLNQALASSRPAARPKPTFRPIGDCLAAWTLAWEDSTAQVLTVALGGDRSGQIFQEYWQETIDEVYIDEQCGSKTLAGVLLAFKKSESRESLL